MSLNTQYGECIRVQEYEPETEGHLAGTWKRKLKVFKSVTIDPDTDRVVREFDSPTYVKHEFDNVADAANKSAQLVKSNTRFTVHYVMDGRSGANDERAMPADLNYQFLRAFMEAVR